MKKLNLTREYLQDEYSIKQRSMGEIARESNCSIHTVKSYLKKHNIDVRVIPRYSNRDITDQQFGRWTALYIDPIKSKKNEIYWYCRCECGKIKSIRTINLFNGSSKSCGCSLKYKMGKQTRFNGQIGQHYKKMRRCDWGAIVIGAIDRNINIDISMEEAYKVFEEQGGRCVFTGLNLKMGGKDKTASLDRIDSSKDYNIDNIQWVHKRVNMMKGTHSNQYFIYLCNLITDNLNLSDFGFLKILESKKVNLQPYSFSSYHRYEPVGQIVQLVWLDISNSHRNKRSFELTKEYCWNLFLEQKGKCVFSGLPLYLPKSKKEIRFNLRTASLDRINNNLDYIEGNVRWTHKHINAMRSNMSYMDFIFYCESISRNCGCAQNMEVLSERDS